MDSNNNNNEHEDLFEKIIFFLDLSSLSASSQKLTNFVKQNSPSVQFLEAGFYEVFDKQNKEKLIATISSLEKVFVIWNQLKMISICYRGFLKSLFKLKDTLNEDDVNREISSLLLKSWKNLNIFSLKEIMSVWPDWIELLPKKEVIEHINDLICNKEFKTAVILLNQFKLHDSFDRHEIVNILLSKNHTDGYDLLVKDQNDLGFIKFLLNKLCTNKTVSIASKLIRKFNLPPTDYPEIIDRLRKKHLRYFLREEGWMVCEEKFFSFKEYLGILVDDLIYDKKFDEAYSICKRNSLLENGFIQKIETKNFLNNKNLTEKCTWKPNLIFELDNFEPMEENIKSFLQGTHVNLKDFNIKEENVIFVDNVNSESFHLAEKSLLHESTIIGLDSEFLGASNSFEKPGIAIFQIANEDNIFIFDMVKLGLERKFLDLLFGLFSSPNIKKIGHTISADISQLKRTVEIDKNAALINYFEIPKIYKKLYPGDKYFSLAHITEKIIGKKLSKGDQCSNWNLRPLRRAQMHYSAMDALICIKIYKKFEEECITKQKKILDFSEDIYFDGSKKQEIFDDNNSSASHSENEAEKQENNNPQKNLKKKEGKKIKHDKEKKEEKPFTKEENALENDGLFGE